MWVITIHAHNCGKRYLFFVSSKNQTLADSAPHPESRSKEDRGGIQHNSKSCLLAVAITSTQHEFGDQVKYQHIHQLKKILVNEHFSLRKAKKCWNKPSVQKSEQDIEKLSNLTLILENTNERSIVFFIHGRHFQLCCL